MIAQPAHGSGRCACCGTHLAPLEQRDTWGKLLGLSAERGNCINMACAWAWSEQELVRLPSVDVDAEVRRVAAGLM